MSDFTMRTFLGKGFAQAQVHTVNSTSAKGHVTYLLLKKPLHKEE